jgi:hypothetical protein
MGRLAQWRSFTIAQTLISKDAPRLTPSDEFSPRDESIVDMCLPILDDSLIAKGSHLSKRFGPACGRGGHWTSSW